MKMDREFRFLNYKSLTPLETNDASFIEKSPSKLKNQNREKEELVIDVETLQEEHPSKIKLENKQLENYSHTNFGMF